MNISDTGSHILYTYLNSDDSINVIVNLFGICIYNVRLLKKEIDENYAKTIFFKGDPSGKKIFLKFYDVFKMKEDLFNSMECVKQDDKEYMVPKPNVNNQNLTIELSLLKIHELITNDLELIETENEYMVKIINDNLDRIMRSVTVIKKSLKRFIDEYDINNNTVLDERCEQLDPILHVCALYVIGKYEMNNFDELPKYFGVEGIKIINEEEILRYYHTVLSNQAHISTILKGKEIVLKWWRTDK